MDFRSQLQVFVITFLLDLDQLFQLRNAVSKPCHEVYLLR